MSDARREYMRAYYQANKERLRQKRKKQPRTEAALRAEERYREKKRIIADIEQMQFGIQPFDAVKGG